MEPEVWVIVWDTNDYNSNDEDWIEVGLAHHDNDVEASHPAFTNEKAALRYMVELPYKSGLRTKKLELREE
jgi:hypothetical protein